MFFIASFTNETLCPTKIHNTATHTTGASDHSILSTTYSTKHITTQPSYIKTCKHHLLTQHTLEQFIQHSTPLQQLFQQTDLNTIANTLMTELNLIINTIAPTHTT